MKNLVCCLFVIACSFGAIAQKKRQQAFVGKKPSEVFPDYRRVKPGGWYFSPGATYTLTGIPAHKIQYPSDSTTIEGSFNPNGRVGAYAEIGLFKAFEKPNLIRYLNYGLHYKMLRGSEAQSFYLVDSTGKSIGPSLDQKATFTDHFVGLHCYANFANQLGQYRFLQHSIGIEAEYAVIAKRDLGLLPLYSPVPTSTRFVAALHYKLGLGIKLSNQFYMIPSLDIPIVGIWPFEKGSPALSYFTSQYVPLIFSIRFLKFGNADPEKCPPVYNPAGNPGENKQQFEQK